MKEWFEGKTVAVVGNAESLFHKNYGEEIDSQDVVVRMNKAAMLYTNFECEKTHGKRTDIWAVWNFNEYRQNMNNIHKNIKVMHMSGRIRNNVKNIRIDFMYPINMYDNLKKHAGSRKNPTTGLMILDYISSCNPKNVYVYGFDWKDTPTFTDMNRREEKASGHNYDIEKAYCQKMFFSNPKYILRN
jgi:hypothetical protein